MVARRAPVDLLGGRLGVAPLLGLAIAAPLLALWLIIDPRTPDLAGAVYRLGLFRQLGMAVWDEHWYAGHDLPGYSLLFSPLAWLLGLRLLAVASALASAALFGRLTEVLYGPAARWAAAWFGLAVVADVWIGRLAFALGVSFAVAAVLAFVRERPGLAVLLAGVCAAASPVAGALLALAGVTCALYERRAGPALVLLAPAAGVIVALALLFPEGGYEPYPLVSFLATLAVVLAFVWALPVDQPLMRLGAIVYLVSCLCCLFIHTPMGSNIERYGVLLAAPALVLARAQTRRGGLTHPGGALHRSGLTYHAGGRRRRTGTRVAATPAVAVALTICAVWVVWGPARETVAVAQNASTSASYYAPVKDFLASRVGVPVRVEVPLTRSHWEAALLASSVSLARGWEKQLDERFDRVLLSSGLSAASYGRWLSEQAVSYVALPDTPLDRSSAREGELIRHGLPYLREVFQSRHWRIFAVLSPTPLLSGPGTLTSLGHDSFALRALSRGSLLVRVRFSRYLTLARGAGCVARAPGGWTRVETRAPGPVVVSARFSLTRALGLQSSCRAHGSTG